MDRSDVCALLYSFSICPTSFFLTSQLLVSRLFDKVSVARLPFVGLDASSSLELLRALHCLALSGRCVILTIHQPRMEIFHMFDRILLLSNGQVIRIEAAQSWGTLSSLMRRSPTSEAPLTLPIFFEKP